jgi:MarR family 2-MHQ and catechol resistance regulon transcriptional repressor
MYLDIKILDGQPSGDRQALDSSGTHLWLVLMKAYRSMQRHAERSFEGMELCTSDFAILETLLNRGPQPVNTIGRRIHLTSGSVTTAVDRLETRGYVVRRSDTNDRRTRIVALTPTGKKCIDGIYGRHRAAMDRAADGLTKSERAALIALVKKLGLSAEEKLKGAADE